MATLTALTPQSLTLYRRVGRFCAVCLGLLALCTTNVNSADTSPTKRQPQLLADSRKIQFTPEELRWISAHPSVSVVEVESYAPASYVDRNMNYRGISADLLTLIRIRSGITFSVYEAENIQDVQRDLLSGKAQMAGGIPLGASPELNYSQVWLTSNYVLITHSSRQAPQSINRITNLVVGVRGGSLAERMIMLNYPKVRIISVNSLAEALALLRSGRVDAVVGTEANAEYQLNRPVNRQLKIAQKLDFPPLNLAFAFSKNQPELLNIVNKVLASLPENDLQLLGSSWRFQGDEFWSTWRSRLYQLLILAVVIVLLSLGWGISLRRQIRQRSLIQRALKDQLTFTYAMMDAMPYPVVLRNLEGELIGCNSSYLEEVNRTREEVVGKSITQLPISSTLAQAINDDYEKVIREGKPMMCDRALSFLHMDKPRMVFQWIVPFHDSEGKISGVFSGWMDITERQAMLQQLHESRERADAANRAKTTFLSTMSHEIRTPLNAILGILELQIQQNAINNHSQPMLEVAHQAANNLSGVVGDILDIARIESGRMSIELHQVELIALTKSVVQLFEHVADQKGLELELSISGDKSRLIMTEPVRYKQILSNLISNALKFTVKGSVKISLKHQLIPDGMVKVSLTVSDTGIGISAEDQQKLFKPFSQLAQSGITAHQGTGLGLSICRALCELMQGELTLESQPGVGSSFHVSLRLPAVEKEHVPVLVQPAIQGETDFISKRVLIADDYLPNRMLLCNQLHFLGHQTVEAENGEVALTLWSREHFDVVMIDCNMPVMDGLTLAARIRKCEKLEGRVRTQLLGFTADAQPYMVERCLRAGMDGCLFKPAALDDLAKWLQKGKYRKIPRQENTTQGQMLLDNIASLTGGSQENCEMFIQHLLAGLADNYQQISQALENRQLSCLQQEAHKIKGVARLIKSSELLMLCEAVEQACQQNDGENIALHSQNLLQMVQKFEQDAKASLKLIKS